METANDVLETKALSVVDEAKGFRIVNQESAAKAGELLGVVKGLQKEIAEWFAPIKKRAYEAHRGLTMAEAEKLAPLVEAEKILKVGLANWREAEERKAREEARKLEEEARKKAIEDRLAEAIDLEAAGEKDAATELLDAPIAPVVAITKSTQKVAGVSTRDKWEAVVVSFPALVAAAHAGQVPIAALQPNLEYLDLQARSLKEMLAIPGVQVRRQVVVAARAR